MNQQSLNLVRTVSLDLSRLFGNSVMKGHSRRCFYRIARKKMRWGCDRGADEIEMLGGDEDESI